MKRKRERRRKCKGREENEGREMLREIKTHMAVKSRRRYEGKAKENGRKRRKNY